MLTNNKATNIMNKKYQEQITYFCKTCYEQKNSKIHIKENKYSSKQDKLKVE